jgi:hypothetical protein
VKRGRDPAGLAWDVRHAPSDGSEVVLELPASKSCRAVGRLVAGGVACRLGFQVEQMEDLQLAIEAVLSRQAAQGVLTLELSGSESGLAARVGPFAPADDEARLRHLLRTLVGDADVQDSGDGEWILLNATRQRALVRASS